MIDPELFAEALVQNMELRRLLEQARRIAVALDNQSDGYVLGYAAGLDAARDAVASLKWQQHPVVERSIAAIDVLRSEAGHVTG